MIVDTHSHLDGEEFADDLDSVLQRAGDSGVERILVPNINLQGLEHLTNLCAAHPGVLYPMIGLHPEEVKDDYREQLDEMHRILLSRMDTYVAIGEVGLDFYWDKTYADQQLDAFERQVCWAAEHGKPLMIHARSAHAELVEVMERHRRDHLRGVFHCFSGTEEEARQLLSFEGFQLGIGGVVTFKKSTLPQVLKNVVPLSRIVVETDAPYLAPVPYRGKRNESAFIVATIERLSEIYGCESGVVATQTAKNSEFLIR